MANAPTVNVPPAELLMSFIERAFKSPYSHHEMLAVLKPPLMAVASRIDARLGGIEKSTTYEAARVAVRGADEGFDGANRFALLLLEALAFHPDEACRKAATYLAALLFPERLAVIQLSFELEAASGATFAKRLAQSQAQAAVTTLAAVVPDLGKFLQAIISAASALGAALEALDAELVDKAGRPTDPELFAARTQAHRLFSRFADVVETFAYPDDTPEHIQARTALIGPYRRFLAAGIGRGDSEPATTTTTATTTTATPTPSATTP